MRARRPRRESNRSGRRLQEGTAASVQYPRFTASRKLRSLCAGSATVATPRVPSLSFPRASGGNPVPSLSRFCWRAKKSRWIPARSTRE